MKLQAVSHLVRMSVLICRQLMARHAAGAIAKRRAPRIGELHRNLAEMP